MSQIRSTGTSPELSVARLLRSAGMRYTRKTDHLPGHPDFLLPKHRAVVMVHGCFWHQHPGCAEGRVPSSNVQYWGPKLHGNVRRDARVARNLRKLGLRVIVVWECRLTDAVGLSRRLLRLARRA